MKRNALKLSHWIFLVAVTGAVPLLLVTLFVISASINTDIEFNSREIQGNTFQRPLTRLLDLLPRHLAAGKRIAAGDNAAGSELAVLRQQIDEAFASLEEVHARFGTVLQFTAAGLSSRQREKAELGRMLSTWRQVRGASESGKTDSAGTGELIAGVRMMLTHAGDTSNLILDPDLDSYYVMDMTVCALPQTQERLGRIVLTVADLLRDGKIADAKTDVAVMAALLREADRDRIVGDAQTALNEDANFLGRSESLQNVLPAGVARYQEATDALLKSLEQIAAGGSVPTAGEFERVGWAAMSAASQLWNEASTELDVLLHKRVSAYKHKRLVSYGGMLGGGALVVVVLGVIIRRLNRQLGALNHRLSESARSVTREAEQISGASKALASGANEQAASLEETGASLEEMSSVIQHNSESAQRADVIAKEARTAADGGVADMQLMNSAMVAIKASSDDIANIIKSIHEIAFQTNILALNAAVEAARAGEAGMGFAVVADEVRNLAQRSATAAKETEQKIQSAISRTAQGVEISRKVERALQEIVSRVRQVSELVADVANASREQSQGIVQINAAVSQLEKVTQGNAAIAEQSTGAVEGLKHQSLVMNEAIDELLALVSSSGDRTAGGSSAVESSAAESPVSRISSTAAAKRSRARAPREAMTC